MTRFVSSSNQTAAEAQDVCLCVAADMDFPSGHLRYHDATGTLTIGGNSYTGTGKFLLSRAIEESIDVIAKPVSIALSAVDSDLIATARAGGYQGRSETLYLCLFNKNTMALVDTPETLQEGRMDTIRLTLGQGEASGELNCEPRLRREPRIARNTDADQQLAYTGDRFFDQVPKIQGFKGTWGAKGVANDLGYRSAADRARDVVNQVLR